MTIEKLLRTARSELGIKESPAGSNTVKYNAWYYGRAVSGASYAWCSTFVLWVFYTADMLSLAWGTLNEARKATAEGAKNWKTLAQSKGRWVTSGYKPGDIVVYDWNKDGSIDHVGIVESVNGKTITAIEGNTAVGNDSDGGEVMRRTRDAGLVVGAFRPAYESAAVVDTSGVPDWAREGVEWAVARRIMLGDGSADYWSRPVSRTELAVILRRLSV